MAIFIAATSPSKIEPRLLTGCFRNMGSVLSGTKHRHPPHKVLGFLDMNHL